MTKTTPMTETDFWNLVAEIGWGTKTTDFRTVRASLMKRGLEACKAIEAAYHEVEGRLYEAASKADHDYCNDGWGDTISHVIGLGKAEFERNLANPDLLVSRQDSGNYEECFSYCLPGEMEFEQYDLGKLEERRAELVRKYTEAKGRFPEADADIDTCIEILTSGDEDDVSMTLLDVTAEKVKTTCQSILDRQMPGGFGCTDGGDVL